MSHNFRLAAVGSHEIVERIRYAAVGILQDDFRLVDPDRLSYVPTFIIRGLNHVPVRFRRRSAPEAVRA